MSPICQVRNMKRRTSEGNNAPETDTSKRTIHYADSAFNLTMRQIAVAREADQTEILSSSPEVDVDVASFLLNSTSPQSTSPQHPCGTHATADTAAAAAVVEPSKPSEVVVICETIPCAGGTLSADGKFQSCIKRPAKFNTKHHGRGVVCTIHHAFVKCESCALHVHTGCYVPSSHGYTMLMPGVKWTCQKCTLHPPSVKVKEELLKCTPDAGPENDGKPEGREASEKKGSKSFFTTRQLLLDHTRICGWKIRSSEGVRLYFSCAKQSCKLTFKAKGQGQNGDLEWCVTDMPADHSCCKQGSFNAVATAMTTRVCNLPSDAYAEIQRLACCKSFLSVNIQTYIKQAYNGLVVDTSVIYNIGYRARTKLGISEMDKLYSQQEVTVYTSPSFGTSPTIAGTTRAGRHLRNRV